MKLLNTTTEKILENLGFKDLNEMQKSTLDVSKKHSNILLLAPTGSGKTVAFILSMLPKITNKKGIQVLIIAPTRELVLQIESVLKKMKLSIKINTCYGGHSFQQEKKNFSTLPTILIGTPGRIQDHLERKTFDSTTIEHLIFDEFDKTLEFGFSNQIETIMKYLPNANSKILASATKSIEIPEYIHFNDFKTVNSEFKPEGNLALKQIFVEKEEKLDGLLSVLNQLNKNQNAIVFVNHREACDRISEHLEAHKIVFATFHGGLEQEKREASLTKFRNGSAQILIATDIAARGIDIPELDYVIHYQLALQESTFTHRNGRTARMKASGTSVLIRTFGDYLPPYLNEEPETFEINPSKTIEKPEWITFYIGKGKKNKISKFDLVGFFLQFDFMEKLDLGLIEVKDFNAFVAIKRAKSKQLFQAVQKKKIKSKTVKIQFSK
ncbi:DEAD/DEAH box helicase [Aureivirga marina]|uniref:DEAD/DEAH box helicase n=1 Tax=Aureivirga marina TaxID=1182451 RepID=UPI0018C98A26|nr:DEAD/DEAH box helicase [Aureivirga marina]